MTQRAPRPRLAMGFLTMLLLASGGLSRAAAAPGDLNPSFGKSLLEANPCTAADVEAMHGRRLASMRDVQVRIATFGL